MGTTFRFQQLVEVCEQHKNEMEQAGYLSFNSIWKVKEPKDTGGWVCDVKREGVFCQNKPAYEFYLLTRASNYRDTPQESGQTGGRATSKAKAEAARANGAAGGRPVKKDGRYWCKEHKPEGAKACVRSGKHEWSVFIANGQSGCIKRNCNKQAWYKY